MSKPLLACEPLKNGQWWIWPVGHHLPIPSQQENRRLGLLLAGANNLLTKVIRICP